MGPVVYTDVHWRQVWLGTPPSRLCALATLRFAVAVAVAVAVATPAPPRPSLAFVEVAFFE